MSETDSTPEGPPLDYSREAPLNLTVADGAVTITIGPVPIQYADSALDAFLTPDAIDQIHAAVDAINTAGGAK